MTIMWVWLTGLAGVIHSYVWTSRFDRSIAIHFGAQGQPNSWMSPAAAFWMAVIIYAVLSFSSGSVLWFMGRVPHRFLNIPRKDYWLAPERKEETLAYFGRHMSLMATAGNVFVLIVYEWVYRLNLSTQPKMDVQPFLWFVGAYIVLIIVWALRLTLRFR